MQFRKAEVVSVVFQPVPDTAEVRFELAGVTGGDSAGAAAMWRWFVRDEVVTWTPPLLTGLGGYSVTWWGDGQGGGAPAKTLFGANWTLLRVVVTDLTLEGGVSVTVEPDPADAVGTRAGNSNPVGVACLVKFSWDGGGAPLRGRSFLPVGTEADLGGSLYTAGFRADVEECVQDYVDGLGAAVASWAFVGVSRYSGSENVTRKRAVRRVGGAETNTLASLSTRAEYASQRDRRPSS